MIEGHIVDAGGNYQLVTDVGIPTMFSIYCTLGKWFDADYIKTMFEKLGFDFLTSQKLYMILQTWRKEMPKAFPQGFILSVTSNFCSTCEKFTRL